MSDVLDPDRRGLDDCGCCAGRTAETPVAPANRPGLPVIAYRAGTHSQFFRSMLAELSAAGHPALTDLRTRDPDDFAIALLDAWTTVADVLTFYQERIANESFLRTATERQSVLHLARLIGYELNPGVAAGTRLAFTLDDTPGAPPKTTIDKGVKVQSVPRPGETAQTFETVEKIEARTAWNALKPQMTQPQTIVAGMKELYLAGTDTQLQPGDAILIVGEERDDKGGRERWDFRILRTVEVNAQKGHTRVTWEKGLGDVPYTQPAATNVKVFALRQRAALFGHNAPDWKSMPYSTKRAYSPTPAPLPNEWPGFQMTGNPIDLDTVYPRALVSSWVVLVKLGLVRLYRVAAVASVSRTAFALSAKITRITADTEANLSSFGLRETTVHAHSEELALAVKPLTRPVYGGTIALAQIVSGLEPRQALAIRGQRARARVAPDAVGLILRSAAGTTVTELMPGDLLQVLTPPLLVPADGSAPRMLPPDQLEEALANTPAAQLRWHLLDRSGSEGIVTAEARQIGLAGALKDDPFVTEIAFIGDSTDDVSSDRDRTTIHLHDPLRHCYDRASVTLNANVARATHGETIEREEVLGSGDGSRAYQRFTLRQPPLTYVSADTPSGAESTLQVRVNEVLWHEVPTLYGRGPGERVYTTRTGDDRKTTVQFGDGITGARLPTGQENVRARYRKGIGLDGLVKAGQLSLLLTRPAGVREVTNPEDATGAQDGEALADARRNAPRTVLTLDRAVSLRDYEDLARTFAGVAKALATWTWEGDGPGVFLTVAGPQGEEILPGSDTIDRLTAALHKAGDPLVPLRVASYRRRTFKVAGKVKVDPDREEEKVLAAVSTALRDAFSFEKRDFGQPVFLSEVIAVIQGVQGVGGVDIVELFRTDVPPVLHPPPHLPAELPLGGMGEVQSAELLTLDPAPLSQLGLMP